MADDRGIRVRWWAIGIVSVVGLAITLLPFWLSDRDDEFGSWKPIASSALTNVGTAVLLVAFIFFVERGLIRRVGEVAEQRATAVVDQRTHELVEANRDLSVRLEALQAQLEDLGAQEDSERAARVGRLSTEVSYDHVAEALREANDLGALASGRITIPAGSFDAPRITLHLAHSGTPPTPVLVVGMRHAGGETGILWSPNESPTEMLLRFRHAMRQGGHGSEANKLDADALFLNLHDALAAAIAGRVDPDEAWARGPMYEWIADGWAITRAGVVSREFGPVESCPDGVDPDLWTKALELDRQYRGDRSRPVFGPSGSGVMGFGPSTHIG